MLSLNRNRSVGEQRGDKRSGDGLLFFPDGRRYEGTFTEDNITGFGKMTYSDGQSCYEGYWLNGARSGIGLYHDANVEYSGEWLHDKRHGQGEQRYADGYYRGAWKNDVHNGHGLRVWHNGTKYCGVWEKGQHYGNGVLIRRQESYNGMWKNGCRHGKGRHLWKKASYTGNWNKDVPEGTGKYIFEDGSEYEGNFVAGLPHGKGICKRNDSICYGEFKKGIFTLGSRKWPHGTEYAGVWENDYIGRGLIKTKFCVEFSGSWHYDCGMKIWLVEPRAVVQGHENI